MAASEEQKFPPAQDQQNPDDALLRGCLYRIFKLVAVFVAFVSLLALLVNNYDRGAKAFDKGFWDSAVFFLENVKPTDEHYKEAQEKLRIAKEKIKQEKK